MNRGSRMFKAFFRSRHWAPWAYGVGLVVIAFVGAGVYLEILWNSWIKNFYDILGSPKEHTLQEFYWQLLVFGELSAGFDVQGQRIPLQWCLRSRTRGKDSNH